MKLRKLLIFGVGCVLTQWSQALDVRADALTDAKKAYVAQGFGMFVHFNMPTFTQANFVANEPNINVFNPFSLNTDQWAATAKAAGMKYIVLTAKHVDGFALWDTKQSNYNVSHTTWAAEQAPGQADIIQRVKDSCDKYGIGLGLYYNIADFSNGLYNSNSNPTGTDPHSNDYIAAYDAAEITDLVTRYPGLKCIWADTWFWGLPGNLPGGVHYDDINGAVKNNSPGTLLIANGTPGFSDVVTYENSTPPADNTIPSEVCTTITGDWFYHGAGGTIESRFTPQEIADTVRTLNQRDTSYLLDVTVDRSGMIPQTQVNTLVQAGQALGVTAQPQIPARPQRPAGGGLVANFSFEDTPATAAPAAAGPGANIGNWTSSGMVSLAQASGPDRSAADGQNYLLFSADDGSPTGDVSQDIATVPGQQYLVFFRLGVQSAEKANAGIRISASGADSADFWLQNDRWSLSVDPRYIPPYTSFNNWDLLDQVYSFTATSALTSIRFQDITDYNTPVTGLILDQVAVQSVPEPTTLAFAATGLLLFMRRRARSEQPVIS